VLNAALLGASLAGFILISDLILSDIIDEDEVNTGVRREGAYFGMNAFITRFAIGLEAFSLSAVFVICGYNPYIYTQYAEFRSGLRWLISGIPIGALILGFVMMLLYPLAGKKLESMKEKLKAHHAEKGIV